MSIVERLTTRGLTWMGLLSLASPARRAARLQAFARAERGSELDMLAAAAQCEDVSVAALYLRHAHDESRHARSFANRARELGASGWIQADGGSLYQELGQARFLAFVHRGERRAIMRFRALQATLVQLQDPRSAAVLGALLADEDRHAAYTLELLNTHPGAAAHLRAARRWDMWRGWQRLAARNAERIFGLGAGLLYLSLFPLALWLRWVRPDRSGWVP